MNNGVTVVDMEERKSALAACQRYRDALEQMLDCAATLVCDRCRDIARTALEGRP